MKTRKTIKLILWAVTVFMLVLCFASCGDDDALKNPSTTVNSIITEADNFAEPEGSDGAEYIQETEKAQAEIPNLCYWCGEVPVGVFEPYCANCRCIKCSDLRKNGGTGYIYCEKHNCNKSNCDAPAADDSQYCVTHKCNTPNCDLEKTLNSEYCYHHSK